MFSSIYIKKEKVRCKRMSLWNFFYHLIKSLPRYAKIKLHTQNKETSICTYHKASYTLEAVILFPLAVGFFVSILFLFRILQVQILVEESLIYTGKKTALESSVISSDIALLASANAFFLDALGERNISNRDVVGGIWGVSLFGSDSTKEELVLKATYQMKLPIHFFGKKYFTITHENTFRKWNGASPRNNESSEELSTYVYVTPSGNAYHKTSKCRSLDLSVEQIHINKIATLRGENGQKYYPCSMCSKSNKTTYVYYTKYGYLYHVDIACSSIKRTISKIPITEIGSKTPCNYCY